MPPRDHVQFLAASPNRVALLRLLADGPRRPTTLTDAGSFSRSTVHRNLDAFVDRGWAEKSCGRYALTTIGRRVLSSYESLLDTIDAVHNDPFFEHLNAPVADLPVSALDDATVVAASAGSPHAPLIHYADALSAVETDAFYAVSPIVSQLINDASERFVEDGTDIELVIDESVLEASRSEYSDALAAARQAENLTIFVAVEPVSFGLSIFDDRAFVGAYDDAGRLQAILDGTSDSLRDWAMERFRELRADAVRLDRD